MKIITNHFIQFSLTVLFLLIVGCNTPTERKIKKSEKETSVQNKKTELELASEYLNKLKNEKADTIIFYKRTCINCCDFFNVFWTTKGQTHLTKIYFDPDNLLNHSKTINVTRNAVFEMLSKNYDELKNTSIKGNVHKNKDGTSTGFLVDHYCYTEMRIYANQDSIITDRMKDHDFEKYIDLAPSTSGKKEKRLTNDNYLENTKSKWNMFLTSIENEIAAMPETTDRELKTLRERISEK